MKPGDHVFVEGPTGGYGTILPVREGETHYRVHFDYDNLQDWWYVDLESIHPLTEEETP